MKNKKKEKIITIIISSIIIIYYIVYFGFLIAFLPNIWSLMFGIVPITIAILMIKICIERVKEIEKGELDDSSKY